MPTTVSGAGRWMSCERRKMRSGARERSTCSTHPATPSLSWGLSLTLASDSSSTIGSTATQSYRGSGELRLFRNGWGGGMRRLRDGGVGEKNQGDAHNKNADLDCS